MLLSLSRRGAFIAAFSTSAAFWVLAFIILHSM
jgi:hypothetical protein